MAARQVSRKELLNAPDEFISTASQVIAWARAHRRQAVCTICVFLGAVLLISGYVYYQQRQVRAAAALFGAALKTYTSNGAEAEPVKALAAAKADFERLLQDYSGQAAGRLGRVAYANLNLAAKSTDEALSLYRKALEDYGDDPALANIILNGLGSACLQKGDSAAAIGYFERIVAGASPVLKDAALFQLGRLYAQAGESQKSATVYEQLSKDFPDSLYAGMAGERVPG